MGKKRKRRKEQEEIRERTEEMKNGNDTGTEEEDIEPAEIPEGENIPAETEGQATAETEPDDEHGETAHEEELNAVAVAEATEKAEPGEKQPTEESESNLKAQLDDALAKASEYLEGWQRERAEFTNYRRRVEREREEAYQNAAMNILSKFLPVLDDFDRAMANVPDELKDNEWVEGLRLVQRKLKGILESEGVTEIEALGRPFDPNLHEAISHEDSDEHESDHVIDVLQKGYLYKDRVLRPALVRVAK